MDAALGAASLSPARTAASRANGAKSRGPKTLEGKARSSCNALKHGLRAEKFVLLHDEDARAFEALADALADDLAPVGALQSLLARRLMVAAWRLARADRIESELFALHAERSERGWGRLGLALVRDGNGPRAFDTLLRYRGTAQAELSRALRLLKTLQAEAAAEPTRAKRDAEPAPLPGQADIDAGGEVVATLAPPAPCELPIEPEARTNPGEARCDAGSAAGAPVADPAGPSAEAVPIPGAACGHASGCRNNAPDRRKNASGCRKNASPEPPIEPEARTNPAESTSFGARAPAVRPGSSSGACAVVVTLGSTERFP